MIITTNKRLKRQPKYLSDGTIEIQLTRGKVAIIDAIDEDLAQYNWCALFASERANGGAYIAMNQGQALHRFIMSRMIDRELLHDEYVDHVDCNPLNNRRNNLRLATPGQNSMNCQLAKHNTSGVKGVYWSKQNNKWRAIIRCEKKNIHIGLFENIEDAAEAYRQAAIKYFGEFARPETI